MRWVQSVCPCPPRSRPACGASPGEHVIDVTVSWQGADPLLRPATVRRVIRLATDTNVWEDVVRTEVECRAEGRYLGEGVRGGAADRGQGGRSVTRDESRACGIAWGPTASACR